MVKIYKVVACFAWLLIMMQSVIAQENFFCGTPHHTMSKWAEQYYSHQIAYPKDDEIINVPLTVHIVGTDAGEGYTPINTILNAICVLNENFASANIAFYIKGNFRYINRSSFYNQPRSGNGSFINSQNIPNTLNCYLVNDIEGSVLGYAGAISSNFVVMERAGINTGTNVWTHEIGHALGLFHTFFGWERIDYDPEMATPATVSGIPVELLDGSNCAVAGDMFCDTPPDYLSFPWSCNQDRLSSIVQTDPNGETFRSDGKNFMSQATTCWSVFSEEQGQAMRANLMTEKSGYLNRDLPLPMIDDVQTIAILPALNETVNVNGVFLQWEAIPDATNYLVDVSLLPNFSGPLTTTYLFNTNEAVIPNLLNNRTYFWRVKAFNQNSFCGQYSAASRFQTGTVTSIIDPEKIVRTQVDIFPNPLGHGQPFTTKINTGQTSKLELRLLDVRGKLIQTKQQTVSMGENTIIIQPNTTANGVYVLQIILENEQIIKRLMIH